MALVKTHIVCEGEKIADDEGRAKLLAEVREKSNISGLNEKRFNR